MKTIDDVRGIEREIKFAPTGGYATGGGVPLTNCVIEIVENDSQGRCPMLSLRFYHKPTFRHQIAQESAEAGRPLYGEETPIGVEISLGPEIAKSLIEQIQVKWPDVVRIVNEWARSIDILAGSTTGQLVSRRLYQAAEINFEFTPVSTQVALARAEGLISQ